MKFKSLIFLFFVAPIITFAQVTIKSPEDFNVGTNLHYVKCDTNGIRQGLTGPKQTWDFSSLKSIGNSDVSIVTPIQTPYASQFPNANLAEKYSDGSFMYISKQAFLTYVIGYWSKNVQVNFTKAMAMTKRPVSFGGTNSYPYTDEFTMNGTKYTGSGNSIISSDGYGALLMPDKKKYSDVLRIKIVQKEKDITASKASDKVTTTYLWFDDKHLAPLLRISYIKSPIFNDESVEYLVSEEDK